MEKASAFIAAFLAIASVNAFEEKEMDQ